MSSNPLSAAWRARRGLGFRLALWHTGLFLAGSFILLSLAYALLSSSLRRRDRAEIAAYLDELSEDFSRDGLAGIREEAATHGDSPSLAPAVRVLARGGAPLFVATPGGEALDFSRLAPPPASGAISWGEIDDPGADSPIEVASQRLPDGTILQAGRSSDPREDLLERFRWIAAAVLLPAAALGVVGGVFLTERALRPLRVLLETIRAIEAGELESRVPPSGTDDELAALGAAFNRMLAKVAGLVRGMRESLDNVAHDLRTPMTRLRTTAELALGADGGAAPAREALADCAESADQVLALLNGLMDLSEAETGTMKLERAEVDAARLLESAADLYRDAAEAKRISLETSSAPGLALVGDRVRLRQAVANLLDNAVKYTPAGGRVRASASSDGGEVLLRVEDDGPGISDADLPRIWDRLYRGDRSRSEKGLGLGLSLVRAVALAHRGRAEAESPAGRGARFTLRLPGPRMTKV
jgi:signal transduction histidine kinase